MKKFLRVTPLFALLLATLYFTGCKKCYHCQNTCMLCLQSYPAADTVMRFDSATYMDTLVKIDTIIKVDSITNCTDYFNSMAQYDSANAQNVEKGFTCTHIQPNYTHDFCVGKSGEEQYIDYYDKGGRAPCNPK